MGFMLLFCDEVRLKRGSNYCETVLSAGARGFGRGAGAGGRGGGEV